jgi:hypothetical protein
MWADCLENVGGSTSHNPMGLHGLLQGYSFTFLYFSIHVHSFSQQYAHPFSQQYVHSLTNNKHTHLANNEHTHLTNNMHTHY